MKRPQLFLVFLSGLYAAHAANKGHYHLVWQLKPWFQARGFCRDNFLDLASVHSQDQNEELQRLLLEAKVENAWIGLVDDLNHWKWSLDGSNFHNKENYKNWKLRNPSRTTSRHSCVAVTNKGYWRDVVCNLALPSVCFNKTGPAKYILVNRTRTFQKAMIHCKSFHSGLASIRNQTEQDIVAGLVTHSTWIGLSRVRFHRWSNSQVVKFSNWNQTQPDIGKNSTRRCSLVSEDTGKWFEEPCAKDHYFVCENRPRVHRLKLKMKFQSSADMSDPAVRRQITEQIDAKLKKATSSLHHQVTWLAANNQVFRKGKRDKWEQSNRFEC